LIIIATPLKIQQLPPPTTITKLNHSPVVDMLTIVDEGEVEGEVKVDKVEEARGLDL
jgi:hypothetical protein